MPRGNLCDWDSRYGAWDASGIAHRGIVSCGALATHSQLRSRLKVIQVTASASSNDENVNNAAKSC